MVRVNDPGLDAFDKRDQLAAREHFPQDYRSRAAKEVEALKPYEKKHGYRFELAGATFREGLAEISLSARPHTNINICPKGQRCEDFFNRRCACATGFASDPCPVKRLPWT